MQLTIHHGVICAVYHNFKAASFRSIAYATYNTEALLFMLPYSRKFFKFIKEFDTNV